MLFLALGLVGCMHSSEEAAMEDAAVEVEAALEEAEEMVEAAIEEAVEAIEAAEDGSDVLE